MTDRDAILAVLNLLAVRRREFGYPHVGMMDMTRILNSVGVLEEYEDPVRAYYKEFPNDEGFLQRAREST